MNTYCGNNRLEPSVVNGTRRIGTRPECLKKGFGVGMSMPRGDDAFEAIDSRSYYCGGANRLPRDYDLMGSPSICLRKGIGAGRNQSEITRHGIYIKWAIRILVLLAITAATHYLLEDNLYTALSAIGTLIVLYVAHRHHFL